MIADGEIRTYIDPGTRSRKSVDFAAIIIGNELPVDEVCRLGDWDVRPTAAGGEGVVCAIDRDNTWIGEVRRC